MTTLTLELPPELIERLHSAAAKPRKPVDAVVRNWLEEHLPPNPQGEDRRTALRDAGRLAEVSPDEIARAEVVTITLEEVSSALERAGGCPSSEVVIEQRGPTFFVDAARAVGLSSDDPHQHPVYQGVWRIDGRSHNDTCSGCNVSVTTELSSEVSIVRSTSSRSRALNDSTVRAASYVLR
jgi:hypothetical protein